MNQTYPMEKNIDQKYIKEIERYNKHMDEILEVKASLLQANEGGELYIDDPDQEAENDAIFLVLSKHYPEVYG